MMACRRLAREAVAASLRRGAATAPVAPARASFSAAAAVASCSSRAPVAASPVRYLLARYLSPAFQPRAAELGPSLAARVALGLRPQMSGKPCGRSAGASLLVFRFIADQESGRELCGFITCPSSEFAYRFKLSRLLRARFFSIEQATITYGLTFY
jgi:hypothetical protein